MSTTDSSKYTGSEQSFVWSGRSPISSGQFDVRPPNVPRTAKPIYDADLDCIIGYQTGLSGVFRTYDLEGRVSVSERPLEAPLFDPFDVVFVIGGLWKAGVRQLTRAGVRGLGVTMGQVTLLGLRARFSALSKRPLRFAAAPLAHMQEEGRFVPVHILRLAIRYGKRTADPKGHRGIYRYARSNDTQRRVLHAGGGCAGERLHRLAFRL